MENFDYTISIGQLGEQLTLNQWVLGSSPRWCTRISPTEAWGLFFCITPRESGRLCTIPFGAASAFAQALRFSGRARRWNHPIKPSFTAGL